MPSAGPGTKGAVFSSLISIDYFARFLENDLYGGTIMVIHRNEMKTEVKEKLRGGEGSASFVHLADCEKEKNIRMLAELTLQPGSSIGRHNHETETEYFIILSGSGTVNDNGMDVQVKTGDSIITGNGAFHSIANTGSVPLVFHAVIVTY
jgi:mannose-6-phosphate isomerase-like protein (cupin superfamily)